MLILFSRLQNAFFRCRFSGKRKQRYEHDLSELQFAAAMNTHVAIHVFGMEFSSVRRSKKSFFMFFCSCHGGVTAATRFPAAAIGRRVSRSMVTLYTCRSTPAVNRAAVIDTRSIFYRVIKH